MVGRNLIFIMVIGMMFSGCTMMTVGYEKTYCDEHGADYADAGVCDDPWTIYQNRHALGEVFRKGACGCSSKKR